MTRACLLLLLASPAMLRAQPADVRASAEASSPKVTLSGSVRVTLTLDGPAPLRVTLPKQLLTADADTAWRIRPDGAAAVAPLANGRERWRQVYRLDPYIPSEPPGQPLALTFNPATVNGQSVTWPALAVVVEKTVGAEATVLPVTPPEDVPSPTPPPERPSLLPWVAGIGGLVLAAVLVAVGARTRRTKPVPPGEWALAELAKLEGGGAGAESVVRVAKVLRLFVKRRFAIPATTLTTAELSAAATEQGWPVAQTEPLRTLLDACDRAKFAGDVPDDDECRRLVRLAVNWVNDYGRPAEPR